MERSFRHLRNPIGEVVNSWFVVHGAARLLPHPRRCVERAGTILHRPLALSSQNPKPQPDLSLPPLITMQGGSIISFVPSQARSCPWSVEDYSCLGPIVLGTPYDIGLHSERWQCDGMPRLVRAVVPGIPHHVPIAESSLLSPQLGRERKRVGLAIIELQDELRGLHRERLASQLVVEPDRAEARSSSDLAHK